jgi:hypothetical protein
MNRSKNAVIQGNVPLKHVKKTARGEYVLLLGEPFYKIQNFDALEPFFMTVVSGSDHWLFISSKGGLTAGRVSSDQALFPYYTEDKIADNSESTGNKTILQVRRFRRTSMWEPLSDHQWGRYTVIRNLYKNISGTALAFEEQNLDLGLTYRYAWRTSEQFGFVKTAWLVNQGESPCRVEFLDGLQNVLPATVTEQTQNTFSCLLDAYKRSEVDPQTGLAIFTLNSRLTDKAEPSESLLATTVAQLGLPQANYLLSSAQLDDFRAGEEIVPETEVRGQRGAYFVHTALHLASQESRSWYMMADVQQDSAAIARRCQWLQGDPAALVKELEADIASGQANLWKMVASADGLQVSSDRLCSNHHFANVMFNVMRGGVFADQYWINSRDFLKFVSGRNRSILDEHPGFFAALPERVHLSELQSRAEAEHSVDLIRLSYAYLPLIFSRRHGDPSRPWNRFVIHTRNPDGSMKLDYEGNWRDIFQNWEALAYSYPEFVESMISTFLNATTPDGYNPYRIAHHGIDWEVPEPGNPWANIGYWSDHQIIYLQKLMEISTRVHPGKLLKFMASPIFSYANVPYRLKPYTALLQDPNNTIEFDWELQRAIEQQVDQRGTDAKLVCTPEGRVLHASLAEKLLTLWLAKLVNFVPEGGIWMNTQRPEWNDANNALVGKGLSVVTLCYFRRALAFCRDLFNQTTGGTIPLHTEVHSFYVQTGEVLRRFQSILPGSFNDGQRREMMDELGRVGSDYRSRYYRNGFSGEGVDLPVRDVIAFLELVQIYVEHSLRANRRADNMYHAYNILHLADHRASVSNLSEMLEGQVAVLSSGMLSGDESAALLLALRGSALFRADQHSYLLYPDRNLPGFMQKNSLAPDRVQHLELFKALMDAQDQTLITRDVQGIVHFSGQIRNFQDVQCVLDELKNQPRYEKFVEAEFEEIKELFEETFHHDEFTGRAGTFFAYEGLGSIYWHMVSKLLLAVQETALRYQKEPAGQSLVERYADIRQGFGFKKTLEEYGAFPSDPYSHTPKGRGAKQPGMTGMVKEAILARQGELGLTIENGSLVFDRLLLDPKEFLPARSVFSYLDVQGQRRQMDLEADSLAYTFCQTPVVITIGEKTGIEVHFANGALQHIRGSALGAENSQHVFARDGFVQSLLVTFPGLHDG